MRCPDTPGQFDLGSFGSLINSVRRLVSLAPAHHPKPGYFTANGGALWFETAEGSLGLVEGSTPECRGPSELLLYQRAQDALLAEAAKTTGLYLLKNNRDSRGHVYGAQESYEATLASSIGLLVWRLGVLLLLPLSLLPWMGLLGIALAFLLTIFVAAFIKNCMRKLLRLRKRSRRRARKRRDPVREVRSERRLFLLLKLAFLPLAAALFVLLHFTGFRRARRSLLPFLISRPILSGCGTLEAGGECFGLSEKAPTRNCIIGYTGFFEDRPIFTFGSFFQALTFLPLLSPRFYLDLFGRRQRLQIAIGDSNMAQAAEYLRVGTTVLVLDMIEAKALPKFPRVRHPLRALRAICADPSLKTTVRLSRGQRATALEIQWFYLEACKHFLKNRGVRSEEAEDVMRRWEKALRTLEECPEQLVGSLDWITKKYLLDEAGSGAPAAVKKKIDLRYHELGSQGYYHLLDMAGLTDVLVEPDVARRVIQVPPPSTRAAERGRYIRAFLGKQGELRVRWDAVILGRGVRRKVIRLSPDFGRNSSAKAS